MGVELAPDEVAFRCNLVTVARRRHDGRLRRRPRHERAEPPDRRRARRARSAAGATACASTRASSTATCASCRPTWPTPSACRRTTSPGSRRCCPPGPAAAKLIALDGRVEAGRGARRCRGRLGRDADLAVGPGRPPAAPRLRRRGTASRAGCRRRSTSSAGSACSPGIEVRRRARARPPGSTTTTSRSATPRCASLADRDFFLLHVEATDEAGHQGAIDEKVASLERWDADVIGPLVDALDGRAVPRPAAARPRDAVRAAHPHVRPGAVPACSTPNATGAGGAYTERGGRRLRRWSPRTRLMARLLA